MRKAIVILMVMTLGLVLAGCSIPFVGKEEPKEQPKQEKKTQEQIVAPYIGYAPLDKKTAQIVEAVEQSFPEESKLEILKYESGDNNKAIIRIEKLKDGKWETTQEQSLFLIHNVRNGYMVFNGDNGISVNTDIIKSDDKELKNAVHFEKEKYAEAVMFEKPEDSEGRMDLTDKCVLMMGYEKEPIHVLNGNIVAPEKGEFVDINALYHNRDDILGKVKQTLTAVTIEFAYDENIPKMPYFSKGEKDISYVSGLYRTAEVQLQAFAPKEEVQGYEWRKVGEPVEFPLKETGEMTVNGKGLKTTVKIGDKKADFTIPKNADFTEIYEVPGITEEFMPAKNGLVIKVVEQSLKPSEFTDTERMGLEATAKTTTATDIYEEMGTSHIEMADTSDAVYYALILNVK